MQYPNSDMWSLGKFLKCWKGRIDSIKVNSVSIREEAHKVPIFLNAIWRGAGFTQQHPNAPGTDNPSKTSQNNDIITLNMILKLSEGSLIPIHILIVSVNRRG